MNFIIIVIIIVIIIIDPCSNWHETNLDLCNAYKFPQFLKLFVISLI